MVGSLVLWSDNWRPGQDHLAVRRLDLPAYDGSDSFVPWTSPGR